MKKTKSRKTFLQDSLFYLNESRNFVYASFFIFIASSLFGFLFVEYLGFFDGFLEEILLRVKDLSGFHLIAFIFYNNTLSAFFSLIFGLFFSIFPVFNVLFNGALVGYVLSKAIDIGGLGIVWRLVPHGIFELPAIFIATGLGIKLGLSFFSSEWKHVLKHRFIYSLKVFVSIVIPLLAFAAIIEGLLITFFN